MYTVEIDYCNIEFAEEDVATFGVVLGMFGTLEEAKQFAGEYFTTFGVVLRIEEGTEDVQNH